MKNKKDRLSVIKELIKENHIADQDSLLNLLKEKGFDVTQATLSRDLKLLKVGKVSDGWNGYYYSLQGAEQVKQTKGELIHDIRSGIISIEFSGAMGVIKTKPGHANSVCYALDALALQEILGTIAGDDTIFILLREGVTKEDLQEVFRKKIPEI